MATRARDIMQTSLITVTPDTPLINVHRLFTDDEISGAPVVEDDGRLVGVISAVDLIRATQTEHESGAAGPTYFRDFIPYSGPDWTAWPEDFQDRLRELRVEDAMTEGAISVAPDAPVSEVARVMRERRIHRVLVVDQGTLVGVISAFDLVALLEKSQG
jgi:CBS domain-containing protein